MRKIARIDNNQPDIVKAYRDVGASYQHLHTIGGGVPDGLVAFDGVTIVSRLLTSQQIAWALAKMFPGNSFKIYSGANLCVEIKDGSKPPSKQALTPDEQEWHESWKGPVLIIKSVDEALKSVGVE